MLPVFNFPRFFRLAAPAALGVVSLLAGPLAPKTHAVTIQNPRAIGIEHARAVPYNFTGQFLTLDSDAQAGGIGSATLVRRHTLLTAGHVVYEPETGFTANATFTRGLYKDFYLSASQVISVTALSGYQAAVTSSGANTSLDAFAFDQGYALLHDAPVDGNWATYVVQPSLLSALTSQFFVLGYPAETFDGQTMAVIVPTAPFVPSGLSLTTGSYKNSSYNAQEGMSGGPVYVVLNGVNQYVAGTTVGIVALGSSTVSIINSYVRAIDKAANKAIVDAEYTGGLIKRVKVTGPTTVQRGQTYTYTTTPIFTVPGVDGRTTNRYAELKLKSDNAGVPTNPAIIIKKTSNTTFDVTFTSAARAGNQAVLQVLYDKATVAPGKSSLTVLIK